MFYLDPLLWGHFVGLALRAEGLEEVVRELRRLGLAPLARQSGVTLVRFAKLVLLIKAAHADRDPTFAGPFVRSFPRSVPVVLGLWGASLALVLYVSVCNASSDNHQMRRKSDEDRHPEEINGGCICTACTLRGDALASISFPNNTDRHPEIAKSA